VIQYESILFVNAEAVVVGGRCQCVVCSEPGKIPLA